ncbi:choice-of-anchor Q domain-containing protein [Algibacter pacificus]|uniref:choice-of-anchor Q domain-containing protein n=1 Tax=Algibacter pacificus TaxID=2599389 RepID=UPI0011C9514D|nr:choice-of-anchor Q domain-containing protein [Algibacter pacificus]
MKRAFYCLLTIGFLILCSSCRKDFEFSRSTGELTFSKDTVYLDTIFTKIGSSTYNLKVYNNSNKDILIPTVKLALGETSNYRLNVDGSTGKTFENVELLAKDSLYIFIETTVDIENEAAISNQFLYTDAIEFDTGANQQKVELVTLVKDAIFIYPDRDNTTKIVETLSLNIDGETVNTDLQGRELLPSELHFTNSKPYVIYGFAAVPGNKTLTIDAGARVYFHSESGLIVTNGASLKINGALSNDQDILENEVIFEGDRQEPDFSEIPGQWGTIWLFDGSINNEINYTTIKNANVGILCDGNPNATNNKLTINNTQIYNSANFGIMGRNTSISGKNVVINNAGQSAFAGTIGGRYNFTHATLVNYWNHSFRQLPAILLNNFILDEDNNATLADLGEANFNNCIIYGNDNPEFSLEQIEDESVSFNFKFTNCLLRFQDDNNNYTEAIYDLTDTNHFENNIFNEDPNFKDTSLNQLIIGDDSAAINNGNPTFSLQSPTDILGVTRTNAPDIGAYQHITFPEED